MGWIPEPGGAGADRVSVIEVTDAAAHASLYSINAPQAVYSPEAHRTYLAFLGLDRDLYVTYYDHHTDEVATAVKADDRQIAADDNHSAPSICVDQDGHIQIAWGNHDAVGIRHVKSTNPHDIATWTVQSLSPVTTYNFIRTDPATGNLYIFYRAGPGHGSSFPAHEYGGFIKSTNGGTSWSSEAAFIDTTGTPESASDAYLNGIDIDDDGLFHIVWNVARGSGHDGTRIDWHHVIFDPSDDTLHTADGTDLGSVVTWSEHTDCLVGSDSQSGSGFVHVDGDQIYTYWYSDADSEFKFATWDGSAWNVEVVPDRASNQIYPVKGGLRSVGFLVDASTALLYGAPHDGSYWQEIADLQAATDGFSHASGVLDHGPAPVLFQERDSANLNNSATASDLVPIYIVLDEAAYEYAGVGGHDHDSDYAAEGHDHDDTYYTESEVDSLVSGLSGEILISDTPSTPLVFGDLVQNEDQDDLVYSD